MWHVSVASQNRQLTTSSTELFPIHIPPSEAGIFEVGPLTRAWLQQTELTIWSYTMIHDRRRRTIRNITHIYRLDAYISTRRELLAQIIKRKMAFFGHACRNNKCNLVKTCILGMMSGKRRRGRPRMQYIDNIKKWTTLGILGRKRKTEWR